MPASVVVAAGATSATYTVSASTVALNTRVVLEARYLDVVVEAAIVVTPTPPEARFTVRSTTRGTDACALNGTDTNLNFDCVFDGSTSRGRLETWFWSYSVGSNTLSDSSRDSGYDPVGGDRCGFLSGGNEHTDSSGGRYIEMTVRLIVQDVSANRSAEASRSVRLYPNQMCGKTF